MCLVSLHIEFMPCGTMLNEVLLPDLLKGNCSLLGRCTFEGQGAKIPNMLGVLEFDGPS